MRRKFQIDLDKIKKKEIHCDDKDSESAQTSPFDHESSQSSVASFNFSSGSCDSCSIDTSPYASPIRLESPISGRFIKVSPKINEKRVIFDNLNKSTIPLISPKNRVNPKFVRNRSKSDLAVPLISNTKLENESKHPLTKSLERSKSYSELPVPVIIRSKSLHNELILTENTDINKVLTFIIFDKLKLEDVDLDEKCKIFTDNWIVNFGILCRQSPDDIDKLHLPLALATEIKTLIVTKHNENYEIKTKNDITKEIVLMMRKSWNHLKGDRHLSAMFYEKFHKLLLSRDKTFDKLFKKLELEKRASKLFGFIPLILKYVEGDNIRDAMFRLATVNLIHNINETNNNNYAQCLVDTFTYILDSNYITKQVKDAWYIAAKEFGDALIKQYPIIRSGKKYYAYFKKDDKWRKCYCIITHEKIILNRYPKNNSYQYIELNNIDNIESTNDEQIKKITSYCLRITEIENELEKYICTDNQETLFNIFMDIKIRIDEFSLMQK
jgi:hypothetical protein